MTRFLRALAASLLLALAPLPTLAADVTVFGAASLADALKEIMGRGQRAVGRSAGTLSAAHLPEMYETSNATDLLAAMRRRFANAFDFDDTHPGTVIHPSAPVGPDADVVAAFHFNHNNSAFA